MTHFRAAGEVDRARGYAEQAADDAARAVAFGRAAELYGTALELSPAERGRPLRLKLGDALASAGRGPEAAAVYVAAIEGASAAEAVDLRRRAAEQLLRAGMIDEGLGALREVLTAIGTPLPETPRGALVSLLFRRALLWMRGLGFETRDESQLSAEALVRVDACGSAAVGLGMVDVVRGRDFQVRHLLLALRAGEPRRIARALAMEATFAAIDGNGERAALLAKTAEELAEQVDDPHAFGLAVSASAVAAFNEHRWAECEEVSERAVALLREGPESTAWEIGSLQYLTLMSLLVRGRVDELSRRAPLALREAENRGDRYTATIFQAGIVPYASIAADQPDEARRDSARALAGWSHSGFHVQHWLGLYSSAQSHLYEGDALAAEGLLRAAWPALQRSLLLRSAAVRIPAIHLRTTIGLAVAAAGSPAPALVRAADRDAGRLAGEGRMFPAALSILVRAAIAHARGDDAGAMALLGDAERRFESTDTRLFALAARRRRGELLGGSEGAEVIASADAWLTDNRVKRPDRVARMLAPGFDAPE